MVLKGLKGPEREQNGLKGQNKSKEPKGPNESRTGRKDQRKAPKEADIRSIILIIEKHRFFFNSKAPFGMRKQ
jgi:hypothetical protein